MAHTKSKSKKHAGYEFEEANVRDDVKLIMPEGWTVRVFKCNSDDSGKEKEYWVQVAFGPKKSVMTACDCFSGKWQIFPAALGLKMCCKHAEALVEMLIQDEEA